MQITNEVQFHFMKTGKSKDISISICFRSELRPKLVTPRSPLVLMLCDRCKTYDAEKKMGGYLDLLYGATLNVQAAGYGSAQIVEICSRVVNPCYVQGKQQLSESLPSFLQKILFRPLLQEHILEGFRSILKTKIEWVEDDPAQYTITQRLKPAGGGDYLEISALGGVKTLMQPTLDDMEVAYQRMLEKDVIGILICDAFDDMQTEQLVKAHLPFAARKQEIKTFYKVQNQPHDERKTEYRNITQSNTMMVWSISTVINDPDYYVLYVTNAMFRQYSTSPLLQEAYERNNLYYSIYSNLTSYSAALGVTTGVEGEHIDKAVSLTCKQFQRICEGDFASDLLEVPRQTIVNPPRANRDSTNSLVILQYQNVLLDHQWDTEGIIERTQVAKCEDILHAVQACELKMVFVLTKEDADENSHE